MANPRPCDFMGGCRARSRVRGRLDACSGEALRVLEPRIAGICPLSIDWNRQHLPGSGDSDDRSKRDLRGTRVSTFRDFYDLPGIPRPGTSIFPCRMAPKNCAMPGSGRCILSTTWSTDIMNTASLAALLALGIDVLLAPSRAGMSAPALQQVQMFSHEIS